MLDDYYASLHLAERKLGRIFTLFTLLAVCIACLGLFALSHYMTARRTREIAVRKVLGGTTRSVLRMLNREFLLLILLANLLAWPAAILAVRAWLRDYPYTPEFAGGLNIPPLLAGTILIGSLLLGLSVVSLQSLRASRTNPAEALRME